MRTVPAKNGATDIEALSEMIDDETASVYIQQPNFFGVIEDAEKIGEIAHGNGAMYIMGCNPISLGIMKTPRECGADIAVGEGQPLGMPLSFGGPYLGYMASLSKYMRKLPGRIVSQTNDAHGKRAYVLAMQAREQHIRREKAGSNICSNEALCALTAGIYMAVMGPLGIRKAASQCYSKAHYLAERLTEIDGVAMRFERPFFHEFLTDVPNADEVLERLDEAGILGGLKVDGGLLWCVTEKAGKEQLDKTADIVKGACGR